MPGKDGGVKDDVMSAAITIVLMMGGVVVMIV
jgi:hypothetical protein